MPGVASIRADRHSAVVAGIDQVAAGHDYSVLIGMDEIRLAALPSRDLLPMPPSVPGTVKIHTAPDYDHRILGVDADRVCVGHEALAGKPVRAAFPP